ncbi:NUDIX domain-containing protein [Candidatus Gracilibacteria bacterium]|nr:NUDIX domain-containing protein [Candidatus Gracilibacteria bacterium]
MSRESTPDVIQTATVAIFSPDMRRIIVIVNETCRMILPPGGTKEDDEDILATAIREVKEEIGLNLLEIPGNFLDSSGNTVLHPVVIHQEKFIHPRNQKKALNSLYFFRLSEFIPEDFLQAELKGFYYTKEFISRESVQIGDRSYPILDPETKKFILRVMRD